MQRSDSRETAALQPFKPISEKCVLRTEFLLKGMIAKVTCFRRVVLFVTRTLSHRCLLMWQWEAGVTQVVAKRGPATR